MNDISCEISRAGLLQVLSSIIQPNEPKVFVERVFNALAVKHGFALLENRLTTSLFLKVVRSTLSEEEASHPAVSAFMRHIRVKGNIDESEVKHVPTKVTTAPQLKTTAAPCLTKKMDKSRDLPISPQAKIDLRNELRNILTTGCRVYKHSSCSIPGCGRCARLFMSVPLTRCSKFHSSEPCTSFGYYPHLSKLAFNVMHGRKNTPIKHATNSSSWPNLLIRELSRVKELCSSAKRNFEHSSADSTRNGLPVPAEMEIGTVSVESVQLTKEPHPLVNVDTNVSEDALRQQEANTLEVQESSVPVAQLGSSSKRKKARTESVVTDKSPSVAQDFAGTSPADLARLVSSRHDVKVIMDAVGEALNNSDEPTKFRNVLFRMLLEAERTLE